MKGFKLLILVISLLTIGLLNESCNKADSSDSTQDMLDEGKSPQALFDEGIPLNDLYGKMYEGGIIFYLNTDNGKGLVAATEDISDDAEWGCQFEIIIQADGTGIGAAGTALGTGDQNTNEILAGCQEDGIAAKLCRDLGADWFLPSRDELYLMYNNLHVNGLGGFASDFYYSSTQISHSAVWGQLFIDGNQILTFSKGNNTYVRAARAF